jgi:hypothetical protein
MEVMGIAKILRRIALALLMVVCALGLPSQAAGIIETSVFAEQGVSVDVTDVDASAAKNKALVQVQMKAFAQLAERLGNSGLVDAISKYNEKQVLPYLKSLSIEQESVSPGRYQGTFTVRFLPNRVRSLYSQFGVKVAGNQGPVFLVLPVWTTDGGQVLWGDTPWLRAFKRLNAEQASIPLLVPLGDAEDRATISVTDAINGDKLKLEAIRRRYDAAIVVVAYAELAEGGVRARMIGDSPLGKLNFDKVYIADSGVTDDSAELAAQRFHAVMLDKFRSGVSQVAEKETAEKTKVEKNKRKVLSISVPFAGPSQWNGLRSRILSTPGILGLDVASLGADGAVVSLAYTGTVEEVQSSLQASGLQLGRVAGVWVVSQI